MSGESKHPPEAISGEELRQMRPVQPKLARPSRIGNGGRRRYWSLGGPCAILMGIFLASLAVGAEPWPVLTLLPQDRILILAPHPDDEVLGCGGIIQRAVASSLPVRIVFLTYGDNNEWSFWVYRKRPVVMPGSMRQMGMVRHNEAIAAARSLGLSPDRLTFLGYPDFGCLNIWYAHWEGSPAFLSMLTRVRAVPYASAWRPGAPYKGEDILQDLETILREFKPTKIFVSHPADHNPDHLALYLFTRVALWDLASELKPEVYPYLIHFKHWPEPRGYHPTVPLQPPSMLRQEVSWEQNLLTPNQVERKRLALKAHRTQYAYSGGYLLSFVRPNELFGDFPVVRLPGIQGGPLQPAGWPTSAAENKPPQGLTDEERAAFIGIESRSVRLEHDQLEVSLAFSKPLGKSVEAALYLFGYRSDRPFGQMPKLHVTLGEFGHAIYDQKTSLPSETLQVRRQPREVTIRVSLQALGNPERILTGARTYLADVPLDWVSWRVLELR